MHSTEPEKLLKFRGRWLFTYVQTYCQQHSWYEHAHLIRYHSGSHGKIDTDFILSDAWYYTTDDINEPYDADTDFLMRFTERYILYNDFMKTCGPNVKREENIVKCNDRIVYIKQTDWSHRWAKDMYAYAFMVYDLARVNDEMYKFLSKSKDMMPSQMPKKLEKRVYFVLI